MARLSEPRALAKGKGKSSLGRMTRVKGAGLAATLTVGVGTSRPTDVEGEGTGSPMGAVMVYDKVPAVIISNHSSAERVEAWAVVVWRCPSIPSYHVL